MPENVTYMCPVCRVALIYDTKQDRLIVASPYRDLTHDRRTPDDRDDA